MKPESNLALPKYRADINGLRAIAVLAVIGFHAFPGRIRGGFSGVDMFFVISGYLISSIIFNSLDKSSFSFKEFYSRRIRRIFPALLLLLVSICIFGRAVLILPELKHLGKHIAGGAGFVSNLILRFESGYFDAGAEAKPLLHLWSLSIEEQFYLFWPLLLWLVWKRKHGFLAVTASIALASFGLNIFLLHCNDSSAAFYSSLSRSWELMIGGLLAQLSRHRAHAFPRDNNYVSLAGFSCILLSFLFLDRSKAFPGWWALLPAAGASLLISSGPRTWISRRVLSNPLMVWIGTISYPLYLWHWPLLYVIRNQLICVPHFPYSRVLLKFAAIAVTFLLSWLTFKFVEKPIRSGFGGRATAGILAILMICAGLVGYAEYRLPYFLYKPPAEVEVNENQLSWIEMDDQCPKIVALGSAVRSGQAVFCSMSSSNDDLRIAIFGDSTANALYPGLRNACAEKNVGVISMGNGRCAPFHKLHGDVIYNRQCESVNNAIYRYLLDNKQIKTVILGFDAWSIQNMGIDDLPSNAPLESKFEAISKIVDKDVKRLKAAGKRIIVTYDSPNLGISPRRCIHRRGVQTDCTVSETDLAFRQPYLRMWDALFKNRRDVDVFSQTAILAHNGKFPLFDDSGILLYRDDHHLSLNGSDHMARELIKALRLSDARSAP